MQKKYATGPGFVFQGPVLKVSTAFISEGCNLSVRVVLLVKTIADSLVVTLLLFRITAIVQRLQQVWYITLLGDIYTRVSKYLPL